MSNNPCFQSHRMSFIWWIWKHALSSWGVTVADFLCNNKLDEISNNASTQKNWDSLHENEVETFVYLFDLSYLVWIGNSSYIVRAWIRRNLFSSLQSRRVFWLIDVLDCLFPCISRRRHNKKKKMYYVYLYLHPSFRGWHAMTYKWHVPRLFLSIHLVP